MVVSNKRFAALCAGTVVALSVAMVAGQAGTPVAAPRPATPAVAVAPPTQQAPATDAAATPESNRALIDRYCIACHNERQMIAGLTLENRDLTQVARDKELWEKVTKKMRTGAMPPAGMPRPDQPTLDRFVASLETTLDRAAAARPNPGRPMLHRLNRVEYANAIRDLLALEIDPVALLPADELSAGFDNIADALGVSSTLLERYLVAADRISATAVGDVQMAPGGDSWGTRADSHQMDHIDGLPLGTRGGLLIRKTFPLDAEYVISAKLYRTNSSFTRGLSAAHDLEFTVDGERVFINTVGGPEDWANLLANPSFSDTLDNRLQARVPVKAGTHTIGVTFVEKTAARNVTVLKPLRSPVDTVDTDGIPRIDSVNIAGPFNPTGPGDTPSRRRIFTCRPTAPGAAGAATGEERRCATTIVTNLARRAFRRPVTTREVDHVLSYFDMGRAKNGSFDAGVQLALRRILADPAFLFRAERDPESVRSGAAYRVSDLELASRLSFFLWSSIPDDDLLRVATNQQLRNADVYAAQVKRMLADPRADALVTNFAGQWLQLRNLQRSTPDLMAYPEFDDGLRQGFRRETELLFTSLMREDRSVLELLTADYTFVNERLARHYGIPGVAGSRFRRVSIPNEERRGLLGHGSMLLVTSHANRTSPVKRGKWILENLMGSPPPPPPPNVPPLDESNNPARPQTMKERMAQHRANPTCANCHRLMDPIGLAMENFDGIGAWRARDSGVRIDTSTQLADGTSVNGIVELRQALLRRPEVFVRTLTENLLTYALGRALSADDMPVVRAILRDAARQNYRFSSLVQGIVTSAPFQMRLKASEDEERVAVR
jgi:mono/diheme cytochrome c family protein